MLEIYYTELVVLHVLSVMVAVGTVTVTDYLHILGLRDPKLEKRTLFVFPHLSNLIRISLAFIYISGILLVIGNPELLKNTIFQLKIALVILVTINGFYLHHAIFPKIEKGVKNKSYSRSLLKKAAFAGSFSIVTWYGIVILSITKNIGYTVTNFLIFYVFTLIIAYSVAIKMETKRK